MAVFVCFLCWSCMQQPMESVIFPKNQIVQEGIDPEISKYINKVEGGQENIRDIIYRELVIIGDYPEMRDILDFIYDKFDKMGIDFKYNPNLDGQAAYDAATMTIEFKVITHDALMEELIHMYQHLSAYKYDPNIMYNARINVEFEAKMYRSIVERRYAMAHGAEDFDCAVSEKYKIWVALFETEAGKAEFLNNFNSFALEWTDTDTGIEYKSETYSSTYEPAILRALSPKDVYFK